MEYIRTIKGCARADRIRNEVVRRELFIFSISGKVNLYRTRCRSHLQDWIIPAFHCWPIMISCTRKETLGNMAARNTRPEQKMTKS